MPQSDKVRRLQGTSTNLQKVGAEVTAAFNKTEDALTALEDREQRRAIREVGDATHNR